MVQGAIFDADGTLLDSMPVWENAASRYLRRLKILPEDGLGKKLLPMSLEEGSTYLKAHYSLPQSEMEIKEGVLNIITEFYRHEAQLKAGARELLIELNRQKLPMAIVTSGDRGLLAAALSRLRVDRYFGAIFTCSELNISKRKPDIYRIAAEYLETHLQHTAVFEDTLYALQTAHDAGFITVAVEDDASAADKEKIKKISDFYITDFRDFLNCEVLSGRGMACGQR